jgi:hypothetical protein
MTTHSTSVLSASGIVLCTGATRAVLTLPKPRMYAGAHSLERAGPPHRETQATQRHASTGSALLRMGLEAADPRSSVTGQGVVPDAVNYFYFVTL